MGAAHAQPSVTLYGRIDASLMHNKPFGGVSQWTLDSGTISGSRWGLMGSEDIGGGLKINFDLQQGFRNANTTVTSISGSYAGGPLSVGAGYQVEEPGGTNRKYTRLSGSYDFGAAVIKALYGNVKFPATAKISEYSISVDVPVGSALTVSAGYGYSKDNAAAGSEKRTGFTLGAMYTLSKRTDMYAGLTDWDGKIAGTRTSGNTKYGLGMRHSF